MTTEAPCRAGKQVFPVCSDSAGVKCALCGWNPKVERERKARIRAGEMKLNEQGLRFLPVRKPHERQPNGKTATNTNTAAEQENTGESVPEVRGGDEEQLQTDSRRME